MWFKKASALITIISLHLPAGIEKTKKTRSGRTVARTRLELATPPECQKRYHLYQLFGFGARRVLYSSEMSVTINTVVFSMLLKMQETA